MVDRENKNLLQTLSDFISDSDSLEEEERVEFKTLLDKLAQGKIEEIDADVADRLNQFLEKEMSRVEEMALSSRDSDLIRMCGDLRNARVEFVKKALQIEPAEEKVGEVDKQAEEQTAGEN